MSKASDLLELFILAEAIDEDISLDALKADLPGNLRKIGFSSEQINKIVKEAPAFISRQDEWAAFLKNAGLTDLAKAATRKGIQPSAGNFKQITQSAQKLQTLARFMVKLKHEV